jgi:hypothetical protein
MSVVHGSSNGMRCQTVSIQLGTAETGLLPKVVSTSVYAS